jgi:hypothetical protein
MMWLFTTSHESLHGSSLPLCWSNNKLYRFLVSCFHPFSLFRSVWFAGGKHWYLNTEGTPMVVALSICVTTYNQGGSGPMRPCGGQGPISKGVHNFVHFYICITIHLKKYKPWSGPAVQHVRWLHALNASTAPDRSRWVDSSRLESSYPESRRHRSSSPSRRSAIASRLQPLNLRSRIPGEVLRCCSDRHGLPIACPCLWLLSPLSPRLRRSPRWISDRPSLV